VKISRIFQPRNPNFWLLVVLNLLSTTLVWVVQTYPLTPAASIVVVLLALGNALLGARLMWSLANS
jgi:hypothetical protein